MTLSLQQARARVRQIEKLIEKYGQSEDLAKVLANAMSDVALAELAAYDRRSKARRDKLVEAAETAKREARFEDRDEAAA